MHFSLLADRTNAIEQIAEWYFAQWGHLGHDTCSGDIVEKLHQFKNRDKVPLVILAIDNDDVIGAAQLKYREMDIFPEKEHWLGGVFVSPQHREKGVAAKIVNHAQFIARRIGIVRLHLQTERLDGGLYARLGWVPAEQVNYRGVDVLVMEKALYA